MLYKIRDWDCVACCFNSNSLIFEKPIYPNTIRWSMTNTQSNEDLAKFLHITDLTGTRKAKNRRMYWEQIKSEIAEDKNLAFWEWLCGQKYADGIVDDYIKRHKLMGKDDYPIWRKPVIHKIPVETLRWKFNELYQCLECINESVLYELAKDCDMLVCGEDINHSYVILAQWDAHPVFPNDYGYPYSMPQIIGMPSKKFQEKYPDYHKLRYDVQKAKLNSCRHFNLLDLKCSTNSTKISFEDRLMFGSFRVDDCLNDPTKKYCPV